jgi:hypothetical protein
MLRNNKYIRKNTIREPPHYPICTSFDALIFFLYKTNTLFYIYSVTNVVRWLLCLYLWAIVPIQQETVPARTTVTVSALDCPAHFLNTIFVSIFIFCLSGRDLLVSYSKY